MQPVLTLTFLHIERSGALEARVREMGERLRRCNDRTTHCHITVVRGSGDDVDEYVNDASVAVKIHVSVPGAEIHADSVKPDGSRATDVFLAIRDAYDSACR